MRRLSILGSTGSIGTQALEVVDVLPDRFDVVVLTANRNARLLSDQAKKYQVDMAVIADEGQLPELQSLLAHTEIKTAGGRKALLEAAARDDIDVCLNGLVGGAGMAPTVAALQAGVDVALSNKESLVMAGAYIDGLVTEDGPYLYPVDSEHSAIWQCLAGEESDQIERLILTGSGGPFRTLPKEQFATITKAQALKHPNWDMGAKITIDSATMMNKGLEVIEAKWLFEMPADKVDIVIHPQSIVHSMVEFVDGSVKAQMGVPDMKVPIQYALTYPDHEAAPWERLDLAKIGTLTFEPPDLEKFPCIGLAIEALGRGGSATAALNMANDLAVAAFLDDRISFIRIPEILEQTVGDHPFVTVPTLEDIDQLHEWVGQYIQPLISR